MCSELDHLSCKRLDMGIFGVLPWKQHSRYHSVSFVMYISGANISEDILDSVDLQGAFRKMLSSHAT